MILLLVLSTVTAPRGAAPPEEGPPLPPFSHEVVMTAAMELADKPFATPDPVPEALAAMDYETYRKIRFNKDAALWAAPPQSQKRPSGFTVEGFAPGFLFKHGVKVFVVEDGKVERLPVSPGMFDVPKASIGAALQKFGAFSGFRLHYPLNRRDYADEFLVFQGGSYFRGISKGQNYGLSSRGLAIDVGEPTGEEFPFFRRFWIERPKNRKAKSVVIHALLDSPRVTGAYLFEVSPGAPTTVLVKATLFPREDLKHVGVGVLTSMYMFGPDDMPDAPDYRPAVHDSSGLAIERGSGEWIWRPLQNPKGLEVSAFGEVSPRGFGLIQRVRDFDSFQDTEAHYEKRPSAWVKPMGDWGRGAVVLVEIPSDLETNDNIVAYWRPEKTLEAGKPFALAYELTFPDDHVPSDLSARVVRSAFGRKIISGEPQYALDYEVSKRFDLNQIELEASVGDLESFELVKVPLPHPNRFRVFVTFKADGLNSAELRVLPKLADQPFGETWLQRWSRR
ncbi:MAG: glucan biosynthesis protein G [Myxococcota bacterium]